MYLIIGKEKCSNCERVRIFFENKNISHKYDLIEKLSKEEQKDYKNMARKSRQLEYPIIIKDNKVINFENIKNEYELKIVKRNGSVVYFDKTRIINAINKAMLETSKGLDESLSLQIANEISVEITNTMNVEAIQDMVESKLMTSDRKDVAKHYILYRNERERTRNSRKENKYSLLTDEFISKYKHIQPPMTELGKFVYYRTYSRWIESEQRREEWYETVRRAVEYNCSLAKTAREEAEKLYDNIFNLRQFLSGRTFWVGGTEVAKKYPMSNYNCAFEVIDSFESFKELFYLLMVGAGVGVRVLEEDTNKLPKLRTNYQLVHKDYTSIPKQDRKDNTCLDFPYKNTCVIEIGDSKEGWSQSIDYFFKLLYSHEYRDVNNIIINYDNVRPKGEKLSTFGGTASGHESIKKMFTKVNNIIQSKNERRIKLTSLDCLDICNIIGENVVVGGVRRTSEVGVIDENNNDIINAKNNLYTQEDGEWIVNQNISHRMMSNNSIFYKEKPTREKLHWQIEKMRYSGEPAFINSEAASNRRPNFEGVNPCFTHDMKLLTDMGYVEIGKLNGKKVNIVNKNGNITEGKVWCSGEKETIKLKLANKKEIKCTPNHVFLTTDNLEVKAENLKGKKIMPKTSYEGFKHSEYIKLGFIQGDGSLSRLKSKTHKGIEVNIGQKDKDIFNLFKNDKYTYKDNDRYIYLQEYNDKLINLGFSSEKLPNRELPLTYDNWTKLQKESFLCGCYSANGSVIKKHRVSYKATCKKLVEQIQKTLKDDFNIESYITTNKAKMNMFKNGEYLCKESYDLNISKYDSLVKFHDSIGFYHDYKKKDLNDLLIERSPKVVSIKENGIEKVYDFTEPECHWGIIEGFVAHNCVEILLDDKGLCNLTTINVMSFVKDGCLNTEQLFNAQRLSCRAGYRMTRVELEMPQWNMTQQRDKLLGLSLTGWQDMINATNITKEQQEDILSKMRDVAHDEADVYSKELNDKEPLLVTTVKPEGTLSQLPTVSSGVHYSHSPYFIRRVRINSNDPLVKVCEELNYPVFPEVGQEWETCTTKVVEFPVKSPSGRTKYDVSAIEQLENYKMFMTHYVDHNCSITVHVRNHEWKEVEQWLWDNWDDVVAVSFLALDDSFYQLLPYESITEEEYNKRKSEMRYFSPSLLRKYEIEETQLDIGTDGCETGVCPIR